MFGLHFDVSNKPLETGVASATQFSVQIPGQQKSSPDRHTSLQMLGCIAFQLQKSNNLDNNGKGGRNDG